MKFQILVSLLMMTSIAQATGLKRSILHCTTSSLNLQASSVSMSAPGGPARHWDEANITLRTPSGEITSDDVHVQVKADGSSLKLTGRADKFLILVERRAGQTAVVSGSFKDVETGKIVRVPQQLATCTN